MTDIVGSTDHASELGDAAWRDLIAQHHAVVRAALRLHHGRELDTAGDGFFATFDAPAGAVACALEIVDQVKELGIEVRAGIHVGEVEQVGKKVGGITVPIASRMMSNAAPGEVLVSSTVRDLATGSGLKFEDRGVRDLKGVPGEWHVYAVERAEPEAIESGTAANARDRRAAAVRRAQERPIWQRRPRLVAAGVVGLAVILATGGLLIWKPWQTPALAAIKENSIGIIDPGRTELIREIEVGQAPGGIAFTESHAWVTNTRDNTVSKIDLSRNSVTDLIPVGRAPKGIAVAEGSVWVANSDERTVSRINVDTGNVVGEPIEVGNGPSAIATSGHLLWVANATDSTVVSINAQTGAVGQQMGVGATPIALAADENGLWVVSEDAASISHLDPVTGIQRGAPIQINARPTGLALDPESVWVASADGTVFIVDRASNRVTAIDVGGSPSSIATSDTSIWVGDRGGSVYRIDRANPSAPLRRVPTGSAIASLAVRDGNVWIAAQASAASHRGDTLRIVEWEPPGYTRNGLPRYANDPLMPNGLFMASLLTADGLVAHRRAGGFAGSALLPDLATSVPEPTNGGLTYTFQLRPGLEYSTGAPVRAADFRRAIERTFQVFGWFDAHFFLTIRGANECVIDFDTPVERCDLLASGGIVTDDATNTVTFNLSEPDPDFVLKLAMPAAYPVPEVGVPMSDLISTGFPGTGPYTVSATSDTEVRLERNPRFRVWDAAVRPDGFPDEIVFTVVDDDATRIAMVEDGNADFTARRAVGGRSPELFARIKSQYPGQWHPAAVGTNWVEMNTSIPPFDNVDVRKALNFAIDRREMGEIVGGAADDPITCQVLPPSFPGYQPYCPYTVQPDPAERWKGPNLEEAQRLVNDSGTLDVPIVVGPTFPTDTDQAILDYLASVLEGLGYQVSIDRADITADEFPGFDPERFQLTPNGWGPDWMSPSNFFGLFRCPENGGDAEIRYCDAEYEEAFDHASNLQATDPPAALVAWAALDRLTTDLALVAPTHNRGADFVSARVGNYQYHPSGVPLFDQMWVQ